MSYFIPGWVSPRDDLHLIPGWLSSRWLVIHLWVFTWFGAKMCSSRDEHIFAPNHVNTLQANDQTPSWKSSRDEMQVISGWNSSRDEITHVNGALHARFTLIPKDPEISPQRGAVHSQRFRKFMLVHLVDVSPIKGAFRRQKTWKSCKYQASLASATARDRSSRQH